MACLLTLKAHRKLEQLNILAIVFEFSFKSHNSLLARKKETTYEKLQTVNWSCTRQKLRVHIDKLIVLNCWLLYGIYVMQDQDHNEVFNFLERKIYAISILIKGVNEITYFQFWVQKWKKYNFVIARLLWIPASSDYSRPQDNKTPESRQGCHKGLGCLGGGGGVLSSRRLKGMFRWMGSHFHNWIGYYGVEFL